MMKITLDMVEMLAMVKKSFPHELIPAGHEVSDVKTAGYPEREFTITIGPKEE